MQKMTQTKMFRKAEAGFEIAKVGVFLFWIPILSLAIVYFFFG
jgi:hypothetical protein